MLRKPSSDESSRVPTGAYMKSTRAEDTPKQLSAQGFRGNPQSKQALRCPKGACYLVPCVMPKKARNLKVEPLH
eukprot:4374348-Amphidinium_carterae.2